MSKLSFLSATLLIIILTSETLAQQPAPQGAPVLMAQAPQGTPGASGPNFGGAMPQYVVSEGPMTYAPNGGMPYPQEGEVIYMSPEQGAMPEGYFPEGYAQQPFVDRGWMDDGNYGCYDDGCRSHQGHYSPHCDDRGCPCHFGGACRNAGCYCEPRWYMRAEAVWLRRADGPTRNLVVYDADGADPLEDFIVLGTNDLDLGTALGLRWTLGRYINERTSIEGAFYGLNDWNDQNRTVLDNANQPFNPYWGDDNESSFDISAFSNSAQYVLSYDADFDSAELGVRRWWRTDTSFLFGFRYIGYDEKLAMLSRDEGTIDPTAIGIYETRTKNDLFGVQAGLEFVRSLGVPWLSLNAEVRAGVFLNSAEHKSSLAVTTPVNAASPKSEDSVSLARSADYSIGLILQLTDHFSLRGGYTATFLNGVAIAPDQLDMTPQRVNSREYVNDDGTAVLHGGYFGGEWIW